MKVVTNTYQLFLQISLKLYCFGIISLLVFSSCGANMEGSIETPLEKKEDIFTEMSTHDAETENQTTSVDFRMWNNKAKQQIELVQDLAVILQDSSLDAKFTMEIEKELKSLYDYRDSTMFDLNQKKLKFKKIKELKVENRDTLSIDFKNANKNLKASFIIIDESKSFGSTSEIVKRLKLISIKEVR